MIRRRIFLTFAVLAPLSVTLLRHFGVGPRYVEKNGWLLKPEDL